MRALARSFLVIGLTLSLGACGEGEARLAPTAPAPVTPSPAASPTPGASLALRILSGDDGKPVAGARVFVNGASYVSNAEGEVLPDGAGAPTGSDLDVDAPGFLPRRTRLFERVVKLWPVADEAEAAAVRQMVYERGNPGGAVLYPLDPGPLFLFLNTAGSAPGDYADVAAAWNAEAASFGARYGIGYTQTFAFQYERNELEVRFADGRDCDFLRMDAWEVCRVSPYYLIFLVPPHKARDPQTIRRVLASFFLGPNPLPGFLNPDAPANELSPLEDRTIRMILQRPLPNRWPDTDR